MKRESVLLANYQDHGNGEIYPDCVVKREV